MTSEEKLLKLIRQKKPAQAQTASPSGEQKKELKKETASVGRVFSGGKTINVLGFLNKVLILVCLVTFAYAGYRFSTLMGTEKSVKPVKKNNAPPVENNRTGWSETKPFEYFEANIGSRNLFYNPWEKPADMGQQAPDVNNNFAAQFKVVGSVLDADPKAIIEDVSSNQTYFLSKGDKLNSGVVKDILEDKVVIFYNNQDIVLTP